MRLGTGRVWSLVITRILLLPRASSHNRMKNRIGFAKACRTISASAQTTALLVLFGREHRLDSTSSGTSMLIWLLMVGNV